MPTASEQNRFKRIDPDLHLIRVEPHTFRGSAHAPEVVEPPVAAPTNRESPEAVEPPERPDLEPPQPVAAPDRPEVAAPEPIAPAERGEIGAPEPVEPPERPEVVAPERATENPPRMSPPKPEVLDLFERAWSRVERLTEQQVRE